MNILLIDILIKSNFYEAYFKEVTTWFCWFKTLVQNAAEKYLEDENINTIGIGYRVKNGVKTKELCVQFTVEKKLSLSELASRAEHIQTEVIPEELEFNGIKIKTDVAERTFTPSFKVIPTLLVEERKAFMDPVQPIVSIGKAFRKFKRNCLLGYILKEW